MTRLHIAPDAWPLVGKALETVDYRDQDSLHQLWLVHTSLPESDPALYLFQDTMARRVPRGVDFVLCPRSDSYIWGHIAYVIFSIYAFTYNDEKSTALALLRAATEDIYAERFGISAFSADLLLAQRAELWCYSKIEQRLLERAKTRNVPESWKGAKNQKEWLELLSLASGGSRFGSG